MKQVQLKYFYLILYIIWMILGKVKLKPFQTPFRVLKKIIKFISDNLYSAHTCLISGRRRPTN